MSYSNLSLAPFSCRIIYPSSCKIQSPPDGLGDADTELETDEETEEEVELDGELETLEEGEGS